MTQPSRGLPKDFTSNLYEDRQEDRAIGQKLETKLANLNKKAAELDTLKSTYLGRLVNFVSSHLSRLHPLLCHIPKYHKVAERQTFLKNEVRRLTKSADKLATESRRIQTSIFQQIEQTKGVKAEDYMKALFGKDGWESLKPIGINDSNYGPVREKAQPDIIGIDAEDMQKAQPFAPILQFTDKFGWIGFAVKIKEERTVEIENEKPSTSTSYSVVVFHQKEKDKPNVWRMHGQISPTLKSDDINWNDFDKSHYAELEKLFGEKQPITFDYSYGSSSEHYQISLDHENPSKRK